MRVSALTYRSRRATRLALLTSAGLVGAALPAAGLLAGPASADSAPTCVTAGATVTCTFAYSATPYSWTVPAGITTVTVTADGGAGGGGIYGGPAGNGGEYQATLSGLAGQTLAVSTGGEGAGGGASTGGAGGTGGGGTGGNGAFGNNAGGGGGASVVSLSGTTLVVAGGGGGGASAASSGGGGGTSSHINGGDGGSQDPSQSGGTGGVTAPPSGGAAGNEIYCHGATAGTLGQGGAGGTGCLVGEEGAPSGGGGGGGYEGGGGGGDYSGGGGGSAYPAAAATISGITVTPLADSNANSGNGQVVIAYTLLSSTTTLTSTPNPSNTGQLVTFTATVSPTDGNGTMAFDYNGSAITGCASQPLTHKLGSTYTATCTTSTLPAGTDPVTAIYSGDSSYATSTSSPYDQVVLIPTSTSLISNPNPSVHGRPVTFTATVSPTDGNGTVAFNYAGSPITGCASKTLAKVLTSYIATCTTSTLPEGTDPVTAVYSGDSTYAGSTSNTVNQVVLIPTATTLTSTGPNPSNFGQSVSFTATVSPTDGGGTVTFKDNGTSITGCTGASLTQQSGTTYTATCTTSSLPGGTDPITAVYSGDSTHAGSTSNTSNQVVNADRTRLRASGELTTNGDIFVSAQLTSNGQPVDGQLITFTAGPGVTVCTATTNTSGVATCEASQEGGVIIALSEGVFTATFAGTNDYVTSEATGIVNGS